MNDLDKARKWAKEVSEEYFTYITDDSRAAIKVIQSLPDQWVDAEKVREIYDRYRASEITLHEAFRAAVALAAPSLPTLAELIGQGNDPQQYQWMQAKIHRSDDLEGVIFFLTDDRAKIMFRDGTFVTQNHEDATPLPDLPRLEWPSQEPRNPRPKWGQITLTPPTREEEEEVRKQFEEPTLPRPEDVPAGEAWIVMNEGCRGQWVGARDDSGTTNWPWILVKIDGTDYALSQDVEVTLVSRLVPAKMEAAKELEATDE